MDVLSWGNLKLSVDKGKLATFTDYSRKASYKTESKENGTSWPKTANKGPELGEISFNAILARGLGITDVRAEVDKWLKAAESGEANTLLLGGIQVGSNKWQLRDATEKETYYDFNARLVQATISVTFQEYASAGSASGVSSGGSKTKKAKKSSAKKKVTTKTKKASKSLSSDTSAGSSNKSGTDITQIYHYNARQKKMDDWK